MSFNKENRIPLAPVAASAAVARAPLGILKGPQQPAVPVPTTTTQAVKQKIAVKQYNVPLESDFSALLSYNGPDPLGRWLSYLAAAQPLASPGQMQEILTECTGRLESIAEYANNPKYLKLWIQLADIAGTADVIFPRLEKLGIGTKLAMIYQARAIILEQKQLWNEADAVYMQGLMAQADPLPVLIQNYNKFKCRMMENKEKTAKSQAEPEKIKEEKKIVNNTPQPAPKIVKAAPVVAPSPAPVAAPAAPVVPVLLDYDSSMLVGSNGEEQSFEEYRAKIIFRRLAAAERAAAEEAASGMEFTMAHNGSIVLNENPRESIITTPASENRQNFEASVAALLSVPTNSPTQQSPSIENFLDLRCARTPTESSSSGLVVPSPTVFTKEAFEDVDAMFKDPTSEFSRFKRLSVAPDVQFQTNSLTTELAEALANAKNSSSPAESPAPVGSSSIKTSPVAFGIFCDAENEESPEEFSTKSGGIFIHEDTELIQARLGEIAEDEENEFAAPANSSSIAVFQDESVCEPSPDRSISSIPIFNDENSDPKAFNSGAGQGILKRQPLQARQNIINAGNSTPLQPSILAISDETPGASNVAATPAAPAASFNSVQPLYNLQGHLLTPILETSHESDSSSVSASSVSISTISAQSRAVANAIARSPNAEFEESIDPFEFDTRQGLLCEMKAVSMDGVTDLSGENSPFHLLNVVVGDESDIDIGERLLHVDSSMKEFHHNAIALHSGNANLATTEEDLLVSTFSVNDLVSGEDFLLRVQQPADGWEFFIGKSFTQRIQTKESKKKADEILHYFSFPSYFYLYSNLSCSLTNSSSDKKSFEEILGLYKKNEMKMEESLLAYYSIEMMRILSFLHGNQFLHGNFLLENLEIRENSSSSSSSPALNGLKVRNFHSAIDFSLFPEGTLFFSPPSDKIDNSCKNILSYFCRRPWTVEIDLLPLCENFYQMIFQQSLKKVWAEQQKFPFNNGSLSFEHFPYRTSWEKAAFHPLFEEFLGPASFSCEKSSFLLEKHIKRLESLLQGERQGQLKMLLCKQGLL